MAEENEKKPKATLIKHRKGESEESSGSEAQKEEKSEKKKVKVVLKRKSKSTDQSGSQRSEEAGEQSQPRQQPQAGKQPEQEQSTGQAGSTAGQGRQSQGRQESPAGPQERRDHGGDRRRSQEQTSRRGGDRSEPRPSVREGADRSGYGRSRDTRQGDNRDTRQGDSRTGSRPGGDRNQRSGPARGGERGTGGGAPQGRSGGRPGGAGGGAPQGRSGGRPAPGAAPQQQEERKPSGKKFFKTKKKENYQKREREKEKEIQYRNKQQRAQQQQRANPVPKQVDIMEVVTVSELAKKMNLKASDLISKLMNMGMMVTINQQIDADTAQILADEYGCKVNIVSLYDETLIDSDRADESDMGDRAPVVTVMGHVDHGKTKLLDAIRSADVASGEAGGITQHIGAYQVEIPQGARLTFIDTPGHEAFTLMRARGAQVTDIVILVVAADDGVMPQTKEAATHAKEAGVPIIVAINKVDLPNANPDRVMQQLSDLDLVPEAWGGTTLYCQVSALKHEGIDALMDTLLLQAEMLELKASFSIRAEGKIIESKVDPGRGTVCTVLVQKGTLRIGDNFVAGIYPGRVRAMFNDRGERVEEAPPSMPVEILGLDGLPNAGDPFQVTASEKVARQVGDKRQELKKVEEAQNVKKITLDNLYDSIQEGEVQELKVVIKGDVQGSVEALKDALKKLSTSEVRLNPIQAAAGAIHESDVMLASASSAIIIGFHVRPTPKAQEVAEREKVEIRKYNVIYDAVEDVRSAMEGMLAPERHEEAIATVEVRDLFKVPKVGIIAGCYVLNGKVRRNASVHVYRDGVEVFTSTIDSLKRFKDDVREVDAGYECGIGIKNFNDLKVGDQLEVFQIREVERKLEQSGKGA
jgi:translation initiation factor IF-2